MDRQGDEQPEQARRPRNPDWSDDEVRLVVADYFSMLEPDLLGGKYSKTRHRDLLRPRLNGRSDQSVEFKHANVSAVLVGMGLPYIRGYKPRGHFQTSLVDAVDQCLAAHPSLLDQLAAAPALDPEQAPAVEQLNPKALIVAAPERLDDMGPAERPLSRRGRRIDFAERDAANRRLGRLGEQFVVRLEEERLRLAQRDDLARRVRWVADQDGDGLGYDVLSFDQNTEAERWIEVKTTRLGLYFPFYATATEVRCSEEAADRFHLHRVFEFASRPRLYILAGSLRERAGWSRRCIGRRSDRNCVNAAKTAGSTHHPEPASRITYLFGGTRTCPLTSGTGCQHSPNKERVRFVVTGSSGRNCGRSARKRDCKICASVST